MSLPMRTLPSPYSDREMFLAEIRLKCRGWKQIKLGAEGLEAWDHTTRRLRLVHSVALEQDGLWWEHVSFSRPLDGELPTWDQVRDAFRNVAGDDATGIIVIPTKANHANIAEVAHVWCCLSRDLIPDVTRRQVHLMPGFANQRRRAGSSGGTK